MTDVVAGDADLDGVEMQTKGRKRAVTYSAAMPDNTPTVLTFSNLSVQTKTSTPKVLLNNLSGSITGGFWAIMGASGGGKTTLLSTLSLRLDPSFMHIDGDIRLNGREYSANVLKAMSAYVMQDDLMHAEFTVAETLNYAAQLRMKTASNAERQDRIEEVLELMGISHVQNVIIGNSRRKGISGGERKRVSVAIELLNKPKLIFLDEPTSGLDSTTAFVVCKALKRLAESGECTVVCTIHQPMPKIFRLFDNLILMRKGQIAYLGHAMKTIGFLEQIEQPCPPDENLADHLLKVVSSVGEGDEKATVETSKMRIPVDLTFGIDKPFYTKEGASHWGQEFKILFQRGMVQYIRRWDIIMFNLCATILIAVFIGFGFWRKIGDDPSQIKYIRPSVFFAMVNQGVVGSLQAITSFPVERAIVLRERQAGAYQVSSYFMAKTMIDLVTQLWPPMLFACIVYFSVGYQPSAGKFFMYMFFCILDSYAATSLCTVVVCTCVSIERSTVVLSFIFEITRLFGGYYTSPKQLHDFPHWRWADALSYLKYAYIGTVLNELEGEPGGAAIIDQYGYDEYTISFCIGILIVFIVGCRLLAYLGLRFLKM